MLESSLGTVALIGMPIIVNVNLYAAVGGKLLPVNTSKPWSIPEVVPPAEAEANYWRQLSELIAAAA